MNMARPNSDHFGPETNKGGRPGRGQLENWNVTIKSQLTYMNLTHVARRPRQNPVGGIVRPAGLCAHQCQIAATSPA